MAEETATKVGEECSRCKRLIPVGETFMRRRIPYAVTTVIICMPCVKDEDNGIPRRSRIDRYSPGETAIRAAMQAVEAMGADVRLTEAVIHLQDAQTRVADFVDGVAPEPALTKQVADSARGVVANNNCPGCGTLMTPNEALGRICKRCDHALFDLRQGIGVGGPDARGPLKHIALIIPFQELREAAIRRAKTIIENSDQPNAITSLKALLEAAAAADLTIDKIIARGE